MSDMEQRSDAWFAARLGLVTASRVADVIAKTKKAGEPSASRSNYMAELITERLTGVPAERFQSAAMQWGTDQEDNARVAYEFYADASVEQVGFILHPRIQESGASPDGLVGSTGLVEIKAPNTATHIDTLLKDTVPGKYVTQMQWQMACTEREFCDFVSYDPRLSEEMRLFVKRVERDDKAIAEMEREVEAFLAELADKIEKLRARYGLSEAA